MKSRNLASIVTALAAASLAVSSLSCRKNTQLDPASLAQKEINISHFLSQASKYSHLSNVKPAAITNFTSSGISYVIHFYEETNRFTTLLYHDHSRSTNIVTMYNQFVSTNGFDGVPSTNNVLYTFKGQNDLTPVNGMTIEMNILIGPSGTINQSLIMADENGSAQIVELWRTNGISIRTYQMTLPTEIYIISPESRENPVPKKRERDTIL